MSKTPFLYFALLGLMLSVDNVQAKHLTLVRNINPANYELLDVEIQGKLMIVPGGLGGAALYDLTNPTKPNRLSIMRLASCDWGRSYNWDIHNTVAIGTARECGFGIFNISDPSHPTMADFVDPSESEIGKSQPGPQISVEDVEMTSNYAIFAAHRDGLLIYDISNPQQAVFKGHVVTSNAWSLAIHDDIAYVADGENGLSVVDLTTKSEPQLLVSTPATGSARDIRYSNGYVFLATGASGIDVFDVSTPAAPVFVHNHKTSGFASRVAVHGDGTLVSTSSWDRVEVFRWDGTTLKLDGYKNTGGRVMAVGSPGGNLIYSAEWETLRIFEYGPVDEPDIDVYPRALNFRHLQTGEAETLSVKVENNGSSILNIALTTASHADFSFEPATAISLQPNTFQDVDVTYTAQADNAGGRLTFYSDDPDESETWVKLAGNKRYGVEVGTLAPDFELPIVANGSGTLKLTELKDQVVLIAFFGTW